MAMELLETVTFTGSSSSVTFSNIPQDARHLYIVCSLRSSNTSSSFDLWPNSKFVDSGEFGYYGTGTSNSGGGFNPRMSLSSDTANCFNNSESWILNYTSSGIKQVNTTVITANAGTAAYQMQGLTRHNTGAVTSVFVRTNGGQNFAANSTISIYKVS